MRLRRGPVRPTFQNHQQPSSAATGVLVNDIIGASSDGTLFGFSLIDEKAWRLLRFLQNACVLLDRERRAERPGGILVPLVNLGMTNRLIAGPVRLFEDEDIQAEGMDLDGESEYGGFDGDMDIDRPSTPAGSSSSSSFATPDYPTAASAAGRGNGATLHAHGPRLHTQSRSTETLLRALDPDKDTAGLKRRTAYHVDGDSLVRFMGREGQCLLSMMLEAICGSPGGAGEEIRRRFMECAEDVVGAGDGMAIDDGAPANGNTGGGPNGDVEFQEMVRKVVEWLRSVLAPVL